LKIFTTQARLHQFLLASIKLLAASYKFLSSSFFSLIRAIGLHNRPQNNLYVLGSTIRNRFVSPEPFPALCLSQSDSLHTKLSSKLSPLLFYHCKLSSSLSTSCRCKGAPPLVSRGYIYFLLITGHQSYDNTKLVSLRASPYLSSTLNLISVSLNQHILVSPTWEYGGIPKFLAVGYSTLDGSLTYKLPLSCKVLKAYPLSPQMKLSP
jgi:hypothetical protein